MIDANNIKALAEARSNAFKTKCMKEAEAYREKAHIEADNAAKIIMEDAQSRFACAQSNSQAMITEATAEERQSAA